MRFSGFPEPYFEKSDTFYRRCILFAAIADPTERLAKENELIARMYQNGKALSTASFFEIDDVIDPADTRRWITAAFSSAPAPERRRGKKRPFVDTI